MILNTSFLLTESSQEIDEICTNFYPGTEHTSLLALPSLLSRSVLGGASVIETGLLFEVELLGELGGRDMFLKPIDSKSFDRRDTNHIDLKSTIEHLTQYHSILT